MITVDAITKFIEKVMSTLAEDNVFAKFLEKISDFLSSIVA